MPSPLSLRPYSDQKSGPLPIFNGSRRRRNSDSLTTAGSSRKSRDSWLPSLRILSPSYHGRKRGPCLTLILYLLVIVCVCAFGRRYMSRQRTWPVIGPSSTLVFKRKDLQNIWLWEIASGHHPSRRKGALKDYAREPVTKITKRSANGLGTSHEYCQPRTPCRLEKPFSGCFREQHSTWAKVFRGTA